MSSIIRRCLIVVAGLPLASLHALSACGGSDGSDRQPTGDDSGTVDGTLPPDGSGAPDARDARSTDQDGAIAVDGMVPDGGCSEVSIGYLCDSFDLPSVGHGPFWTNENVNGATIGADSRHVSAPTSQIFTAPATSRCALLAALPHAADVSSITVDLRFQITAPGAPCELLSIQEGDTEDLDVGRLMIKDSTVLKQNGSDPDFSFPAVAGFNHVRATWSLSAAGSYAVTVNGVTRMITFAKQPYKDPHVSIGAGPLNLNLKCEVLFEDVTISWN